MLDEYELVDSSAIDAIGYDGDTNTLYVTFNSGSTYQYFDVSERKFWNFYNATSYGKYFNSRIKGFYAYG